MKAVISIPLPQKISGLVKDIQNFPGIDAMLDKLTKRKFVDMIFDLKMCSIKDNNLEIEVMKFVEEEVRKELEQHIGLIQ